MPSLPGRSTVVDAPGLAATSKRECAETVRARSATFARESVAEGGRPQREVVALGEGLCL
jgi:hypothetical protein